MDRGQIPDRSSQDIEATQGQAPDELQIMADEPAGVVGDHAVSTGGHEGLAHSSCPRASQVEVQAASMIRHHDKSLIHVGIMPSRDLHPDISVRCLASRGGRVPVSSSSVPA